MGAPINGVTAVATGIEETVSLDVTDSGAGTVPEMGDGARVGVLPGAVRSVIAGVPPPARLPMNAPAPIAASSASSTTRSVVRLAMDPPG